MTNIDKSSELLGGNNGFMLEATIRVMRWAVKVRSTKYYISYLLFSRSGKAITCGECEIRTFKPINNIEQITWLKGRLRKDPDNDISISCIRELE